MISQRLRTLVISAGCISSVVSLAQTPAPRPGGAVVIEALGETAEPNVTLFMLTVPPGTSAPLRAHDHAAFAYVVEGEVEIQPPTKASEPLRAGSFFHEQGGRPSMLLHNPSKTAPARVLVLQNSATLPRDAKPLLRGTLTEFTDLEVSFAKIVSQPGDPSPRPHQHPGPAFAYLWKGEVVSQIEPDEPETYRAGEAFLESPGRVHKSYLNLSKTEPAELLLFVVRKKGQAASSAATK